MSWRSLTKITWSGSEFGSGYAPKCHGSATLHRAPAFFGKLYLEQATPGGVTGVRAVEPGPVSGPLPPPQQGPHHPARPPHCSATSRPSHPIWYQGTYETPFPQAQYRYYLSVRVYCTLGTSWRFFGHNFFRGTFLVFTKVICTVDFWNRYENWKDGFSMPHST